MALATDALSLALLGLGAFAMILVGSASMISEAHRRNHRTEAEESANRRLGIAFVAGLLLLLAGWWLA